jgi:16S rRNA (uracil1498-N3)-methyltransferase
MGDLHRFFALPESFRDERVLLDSSETRHLRDVLRLNEGDNVVVFDGCGGEYSCTIAEIKKNETELLLISKQEPTSPESLLELTLAAAMLKGEKFDLVVQKAVELGVQKLVPIRTKRTDVKSKDSAKRVERWRKIAMEASKQCGRAFLMTVADPLDFEMLLSSHDVSDTFIFTERDGDKMPDSLTDSKITMVVGPEGGWDDVELAAARSAGASLITLGGRILRAETAAIAVAAVLQHRFGDLS